MSSSYLLTGGKSKETGAKNDIKSDFVLVFDATTSKENSSAVAQQYKQLVDRLHAAGLAVTSRQAKAGSTDLLVFVRAKDERLYADLAAESLNDWLHDVHANFDAEPRDVQSFASRTITPADRLRLTYNLITGLPEKTARSAGINAGVVPEEAPFERVKSIFPPHDADFNRKWLKRWSSPKYLISIPDHELDLVKDHFGTNIALYFEFLRFYFLSLSIPTTIGFLVWAFGQAYNPVYSVILVSWAVLFVETWRIRERKLSVRWGTYKCGMVARRRTQFVGTIKGIDPVTGESRTVQPWYMREARLLSSVPVLLFFAAFLVAVITAIFTVEVLINEVYEGTGQRFLSLLPTILFAGLVPQIVALWKKTALKLTAFENHEHEDSFERALTLKMFCLNAISAFGSLSLTAYVYIPFGSLIVPRVLKLYSKKDAAMAAMQSGQKMSHSFSINSKKLLNTLFALNTTTQAIGTLTETVVPILTRAATEQVSSSKKEEKLLASDAPAERTFLKQIREEAALPQYETFGDYAEMAQQFGYVTLWSTIWPLVPLAAIVNNFFELRSDAFKICMNARRPIPSRTDTIGPWLETLGFITWLAAFTNASLWYMYRPQSVSSLSNPLASNIAGVVNNTANALNWHPQTANSTDPFFATRMYAASLETSHPWRTIKATLFTALLVGLASEHIYILMRAAVRRVLDEALWKPSMERLAVAKQEGRMKSQYVKAMDVEPPNFTASAGRKVETFTASDDFFAGKDRGIEYIESITKKQ